MKYVFILGMLILSTLTSQAQGDNPRGFMPPPSIQDRFWDHFPDAEAVDWEGTESRYIARFSLNDLLMRAHYSLAGIWQYTDIEVPYARLPEAVRTHYEANFSSLPLLRARFHDETDNSYFHLEVSRNGVSRWLRYDDEGRFMP